MPKREPVKITEIVRDSALRRPFKPSVTWDSGIAGFALHVTKRRSFWSFNYSPRGVNPRTGKRWGSTRHELGDGQVMSPGEARAAATAAKARVMAGYDPHRENLALRASLTAQRGDLPKTVAETLDVYTRALMVRSVPSLWTRKQTLRYARLAVTHMNVAALPIAAIDVRMIRMLAETTPGSADQRRLVFGGLNRFMAWCCRQELIPANPCLAIDRNDRPGPGKSRSHVPSIATLKAVWTAVEGEPACDLIRLMLLLPLRRSEAAGLRWDEILLDQGRLRIGASRTKNGEAHELPLSPAALAIIESREAAAIGDLVFPSSAGKPYADWDRLLTRIRTRIGEDKKARDDRFSLHDTRRAFVSHLAGQFDEAALDQVLGHRRAGVAGIYQRSARWPERVAALNAYAALITGPESDSNVLSFARRADGR